MVDFAIGKMYLEEKSLLGSCLPYNIDHFNIIPVATGCGTTMFVVQPFSFQPIVNRFGYEEARELPIRPVILFWDNNLHHNAKSLILHSGNLSFSTIASSTVPSCMV
jgi:hypothetical protein